MPKTKTDNTPTGLLVDVLRTPGVDCTNGGLTSRYTTFVLYGTEGPFTERKGSVPALKLVKRIICGRVYFHAEPVEPPPAGHVGWMAGGNFVYTSDSRFSAATAGYPVSVHDRSETVREYDELGR